MHKFCSSVEISENPHGNEKTWFPPFYKTINNINTIFSNYFQKRYAIFSQFMMYWFEK